MNPVRLTVSENCGWRGVYLYWNNRQMCRLVFDPTDKRGPHLDIGIGRKSIRFALPRITWVMTIKYPWLRRLYKWQQRVLHRLDGRYSYYRHEPTRWERLRCWVGSLICRRFGHKWEYGSYADGNTGSEWMSCERCGEGHSHTYY